MEKYITESAEIAEFIENVTSDTVLTACKKLDRFWKDHCERTHCFLIFLCWTSHNHAAKGAWATLDYQLRCKIKELNGAQ